MSTYKYASISDDKHAFRLLKLHKGYINEPIRCHLWQTILPQNEIDRENQLVDYIALSYTWGGQGKSAEIEVNGCGMRVTENLYSALRHLRTEVEDQDFWVDAICIDQGNPDERSHQVGLMRRIYQEAFGVYVWLGGSTTETDAAMDAMTKLEQLRTKIGKEWRFFAEKRIQLEPYSRERDVLGDHPVRAGLEQLLGRPWFRRIWILQEIGSARMAQIYCGKKHVSARIFAQFPALLCYIPDAHCQAVLDIMPGFSREESWWSKNQDLHTLLRQFRNSQATEERDMIYALLGISEEATEKNTIEVDYK
ncbi:HET-domain-containing protein, partial [Amniculicola lignicola CBS 123094]